MKKQERKGKLLDIVREELLNALKEMSVSRDEGLLAKQMGRERDCVSSEFERICLSHRPGIGCICISKNGLGFLRNTVDLILKEKGEYFSEDPQNLKSILSSILSDLVCDPSSDKVPKLDEKISELFKWKKYVVYIPIYNINCSKKMQIDSCSLYPQDDKINNLQSCGFQEDYDCFNNLNMLPGYKHMMAEIPVKACTNEAATEIAYRSIGDIVRYFWYFNMQQVFSSAEKCDAMMGSIAINKNDNSICSSLSHLSTNGFPMPIDMDEFLHDPIINNYFIWLSKPAENDVHIRVRESMIWTGEAMNDRVNHHALLKMVIALESLMLDKDDMRLNKRQTVAERTAFILVKDVNNRIKIRDLVYNFFDIRNKIVHSAKRDTIRNDQILTLREIIFNTIHGAVARI